MNMTVLKPEQIEEMVTIMDDILASPSYSVRHFKEKYNLTSEEYEMIMDLTIPKMRYKVPGNHFRVQYYTLVKDIRELIKGDTSPLAGKIRDKLYIRSISDEHHKKADDRVIDI